VPAERDPAEVRCPECKGRGQWVQERHAQVCGTLEDDETRAHFCAANCSKETVTCRVCGGSGELVGIARAVYMARGGAAPVQLRGYS
jgi:hypothetical protein